MLMKIKAALVALANVVLAFLPKSPFTSFTDQMAALPVLGYLNYFVPIDQMISIGEAWIAAIVTFYIYSAILRFVKMID
jgi:hypothetical protein